MAAAKNYMMTLAMTVMFMTPVIVSIVPHLVSVILAVNVIFLALTYLLPPYGWKRYAWYSEDAHTKESFDAKFWKRSTYVLGLAVIALVTINAQYWAFQRPAVGGIVANPWLWTATNLCFNVAMTTMSFRAGFDAPSQTVEFAPGLDLDIYQVNGTKSPACVYFHAGAFILGSRALGAGPLSYLNSYGIVGFSPTYRLASSFSGTGLQGALDDATAAVRWVQDHASEYGVDPTKIFLMGDSAGGLLATAIGLGVGTIPKPLAAVVANWPMLATTGETWFVNDDDVSLSVLVPPALKENASSAIDDVLTGIFLLSGRGPYRGWLPAVTDPAVADLAPLAAVKKKKKKKNHRVPPILVAAAKNDTIVPYSQPHRLVNAYPSEATMLTFHGADHGQGAYMTAPGRQALISYLDKHRLLGTKLPPPKKTNYTDLPLDTFADLLSSTMPVYTLPVDTKIPLGKKSNCNYHFTPDSDSDSGTTSTAPKVTKLVTKDI